MEGVLLAWPWLFAALIVALGSTLLQESQPCGLPAPPPPPMEGLASHFQRCSFHRGFHGTLVLTFMSVLKQLRRKGTGAVEH